MSLGAVIEAVLATRDLGASVAFHTRAFGLEVLERDAAGALLGAPGGVTGLLRLTAVPDAPAAPEPRLWDIGPRLLGIYSRDLERTAAAIDAAGGRSRERVTYPYGSATLSEFVALGADGLWWTIPRAAAGHRPSPALEDDPGRLHGELHTAVIVPADHDAAVRFFTEAGGLEILFEGEMSGEPFDRMTGIPADASLRLTFLVSPGHAPARLEIMSFTGVDAADLSESRLGLRRLVFASDDPGATLADLVKAGGAPLGASTLRGPSGIEIELRAADL
ncbi:VOC family protein [Actinomadura chokoriensis]|uniref:Glyoxalase/fosfomycin resistance/dioxygenase domain-containing protein n=1 Tax=Actinomadura chokoriensis TaxID=454156 RepID=A0ABV4R3B8_9ACTN